MSRRGTSPGAFLDRALGHSARPWEDRGAGPEPGPDRVMEMEGGNRFLLARRRAHRKDLLKEALNVGLGTVLVGLVSGVLLLGLDVGPEAATLLALAAAAAGGWTLGREVVADLVENERAVKRGGSPR